MATAFDHVTFSYGEKCILKDFTYTFTAGKATAVTGPSGCGKTTLLKLMTGRLKPDSGSIQIDQPLAVDFQEPRLLPWFTAWENLTAVLNQYNKGEAMHWLTAVSLARDADCHPDELSGGMQKRLALARTLAYAEKISAELVILDEPFNGLDPELHKDMRQLVLDRLKGKTTILISHNEADIKACDHVLNL